MSVLHKKVVKTRTHTALVVDRTPEVVAGQVYKAKAKRGWRYVKVQRVYKNPPHARLKECDEHGKNISGRDRFGIPKSFIFDTALSYSPLKYLVMPSFYELVA